MLSRIPLYLKTFFSAFLLVGCASRADAGSYRASTEVSVSLAATDVPDHAALPTALLHRFTTQQATPASPQKKPSLTPAAITLPISITPEHTSTGLKASLTPLPTRSWNELICSPLEFVDLKDLPHVVSDRYNPPPMGSDARHQGVDFAYYHWKGEGLLEGTKVRAVFSGRVASSTRNSFPFGNLVIIETPAAYFPEDVRGVFEIEPGESLYVLYAHLSGESPPLTSGAIVFPCQELGYVGETGNTDASHLHLEMRVGPANTVFEGFSAFRDTDSLQEKQNYRLWRTSGKFIHFDPLRLLLFEYTRGATATPTPDR